MEKTRMTNGNDVLTVILGCEKEVQFQGLKKLFLAQHPKVDVKYVPHSPYHFVESLIRDKIVEMICLTDRHYVALVECDYVKGCCINEDLMTEYSKRCNTEPLLCHPWSGDKTLFRQSQRFMNADDCCFGKKEDVLKYAFKK